MWETTEGGFLAQGPGEPSGALVKGLPLGLQYLQNVLNGTMQGTRQDPLPLKNKLQFFVDDRNPEWPQIPNSSNYCNIECVCIYIYAHIVSTLVIW